MSGPVARERRQLVADRRCYVCLAPIPEAAGIYHADLVVLAHAGACSERVHGERRVYDHSRRGRWRPRSDVLARLRAARESAA